MAVARTLARNSTAVDTFSWTPIVVPASPAGRCFNTLTFAPSKAAAGAVMFSTASDGSAPFTLNPGVARTIQGPGGVGTSQFLAGESVLWAQAVVGTGPVEADFS